jgi:hypothetical protein
MHYDTIDGPTVGLTVLVMIHSSGPNNFKTLLWETTTDGDSQKNGTLAFLTMMRYGRFL